MDTDPRLLALMNGGTSFLREIDPDRILDRCMALRLVADLKENTWRLNVRLPNGDTVEFSGKMSEGNLILSSAVMPQIQGRGEAIALKPQKTLLEALGDISGIPARLRRCLAPRRPGNGLYPAGNHKKVFALAQDALYFDVEGAENEKQREGFRFLVMRFYLDSTGQGIEKTKFEISMTGKDSVINIEADANVYGIGGKRVQLNKKLGLGHRAVIDCITEKNGRKIPSLKVAKDLDDMIPVLYGKERKQKSKIKANTSVKIK